MNEITPLERELIKSVKMLHNTYVNRQDDLEKQIRSLKRSSESEAKDMLILKQQIRQLCGSMNDLSKGLEQ